MKDENIFFVNLEKMENVIKFTKEANAIDCDILANNGTRDAKSLMGLFSIDLSDSIHIEMITDDQNLITGFRDKIKDLIVI